MKKTTTLTLWLAAVVAHGLFAGPAIDTSADRVGVKLDIKYENLGTLVPKNVSQTKNNLTIGGETLDRDFTDYEAYKEYLVPLGMKKIRLQAGWAKTEKQKGVYDFAWLDKIINDVVAKGMTPWLQTSYGNEIYAGGGTQHLAGGMPTSDEAKAAWDKWVEANAIRYKGKVTEWEIWNEPDISKTIKPNHVADIHIRTAEIIKKIDPDAKIAAFSLAKIHKWTSMGDYLELIKKEGKLDLFTWVTYHGYTYRPEETDIDVDNLKVMLKKYSDKILLRQGEDGCPSKGFFRGALSQHHWTEVSQAKWDLRRMLTDHGNGIETSIYTISDMNYTAYADRPAMKNKKGLLETDDKNQVVKIKKAYYAVQNMVSIFDMLNNQVKSEFFIDTDTHYAAYAYADKQSGLQTYVFWYDEATPSNRNLMSPSDIVIKNGNFKDAVLVDILTGYVYKIPAAAISKHGDTYTFKGLPMYDSPMLITDKSLVDFKK